MCFLLTLLQGSKKPDLDWWVEKGEWEIVP